MSGPNPALVAAAPAVDASLGALEALITNLGPDPLKLPVTLPGSLKIFVGTVELQLPVLVNAEWGAVQADAITQVQGLRARLAAAVAAGSVSASQAAAAVGAGVTAAKLP
jgi:hypothetical protein